MSEQQALPTGSGSESTGSSVLRAVAVAIIAGLAAFIVLYLIAQALFVFTETRRFMLLDGGFDALRFFVFPEPSVDGAYGRQTGRAFFQGMGWLCGVDAPCVNATEVSLLAIGAALLVLHTLQLTGSLGLTTLTAALWVISAPVLNAALWQATAYDKLAVIAVLAVGIVWWQLLGRERLGRGVSIGLALLTIPALAVAFNAKETSLVLLGLLPLLAIVRGAGIRGGVRRNLLICALPSAYAVWYLIAAAFGAQDEYSSHVGSGSALANFLTLTKLTLGLGPGFMSLGNWGSTFDQLQWIALFLYGVAAVAALILVVVSIARARDRMAAGGPAPSLADFAPELYLAAAIVGVVGLTVFTEAPSAYYMMLPYWAGLVLSLLLLRRLARASGRPVLVGAVVLVPFVVASVAATASNYGEVGAVPRLTIASSRLETTGGTVRTLLEGRDVSAVRWRSLGPADSEWYLIRGGFGDFVQLDDIWPFLVRDESAHPVVEGLTEGTVESLRASLATYSHPGEVLMVTDDRYALLLLAHEGEVLYSAPALATPAQAGSAAAG